jgi:hypothetical protein
VTELEWSWLDKEWPDIVDVAGYNVWPGWEVCDEQSPLYQRHSFSTHVVCTRMAGHSGRHAAGTGIKIIAVWL